MRRLGGYCPIRREILTAPLFAGCEMGEREAFQALLMYAAFSPQTVLNDGDAIRIERGQVLCSVRSLAADFGWSKTRVERFLKNLEKAGEIGTQKAGKRKKSGTLITLIKYDFWCPSRDINEDISRDINGDNIIKKEYEEWLLPGGETY